MTIDPDELNYWAQNAFQITCAVLEAEAAIRRKNPEAALMRLEMARGAAWRMRRALVRAGANDPLEVALHEAREKRENERPEGQAAELFLEELPSTLAGKRIVLGTSDNAVLTPLQDLLAVAGLSVVGRAETSEAVVDLTLRERPDLLLLDGDSPGMDAAGAARTIQGVYPVCAVVLTAASHREQPALDADIYASLSKPVVEDVFLLQLEQAFAAYEFAHRVEENSSQTVDPLSRLLKTRLGL